MAENTKITQFMIITSLIICMVYFYNFNYYFYLKSKIYCVVTQKALKHFKNTVCVGENKYYVLKSSLKNSKNTIIKNDKISRYIILILNLIDSGTKVKYNKPGRERSG